MRILILDGDTNAGRAVLQSLGETEHECWVAAPSVEHAAFYSKFAQYPVTYPNPIHQKSAFQQWIVDFQKEKQFQCIIPSTECTIIPLHEIRNIPALKGVVALPPADAVDIAFDKEKVRQLADSLSIASPPSLWVTSATELRSPTIDAWLKSGAVVVKSARSKIWRGDAAVEYGAEIVSSRAEFEVAAREMLTVTPIQVQKWVPGKGVGIEILVDHGEIVLAFAHKRIHEYPLTGGGSSYRQAIQPPIALLASARKLAAALHWHGVMMVEFRVDEISQEAWLMEINGRFWGSLPLAVFAGADFPKALLNLLVYGRRPAEVQLRTNVFARSFSRDMAWLKAMLRNSSPESELLLTRPIVPSVIEWARLFTGKEVLDGARLDDPGPFLFELSSFLRHEVSSLSRKAAHLWELVQYHSKPKSPEPLRRETVSTFPAGHNVKDTSDPADRAPIELQSA